MCRQCTHGNNPDKYGYPDDIFSLVSINSQHPKYPNISHGRHTDDTQASSPLVELKVPEVAGIRLPAMDI